MRDHRLPQEHHVGLRLRIGLAVAAGLIAASVATAQPQDTGREQSTNQQGGGGSGSGQGGGIAFRDPLDNTPLDVPIPEGDELTEAVKRFHQTGENIYVGDAKAVAEGTRHYQRLCQACHLPDATGRMGPSLVDGKPRYPRNDTAVGMFETIYAGAAGAMQSFRSRLSQDEILETIAFIESLKKKP